MPSWLVNLILTYIVPLAVTILQKYGIPALEAQFPELAPLLDELLALLGKKECPGPSCQLQAAASSYKAGTP